MDLPDSDWGDFSCRRAVDSSSLFYNVPTINKIFLLLLLLTKQFKSLSTERTKSVFVTKWNADPRENPLPGSYSLQKRNLTQNVI